MIIAIKLIFAVWLFSTVVRCDDCLFTNCDCSKLASSGLIACNPGTSTPQSPITLNANYPTTRIGKLLIQGYTTVNPLSNSKIFSGLIIDELVLDKNKMLDLKDDTFFVTSVGSITITSCTIVNVSSNFFTPIANTLSKLAVTECTFPDSGINVFEKAFESLFQVDELGLSKNKLSNSLASILAKFLRLKTLDLSGNDLLGPVLQTTKDDVFVKNILLNKLKLDGCGISNLDPVLKILSATKDNLQVLTLTGNTLTSLPSFSNFTNLKELDLSGNQIVSVTNAFASSTNLVKLNLKNNKINSIDANWFPTRVKLAEIDLSGNQLTAVPSLKGLPWLSSLNLAGQANTFTSLAAYAFERMASIPMTVDLSGNNIDQIDKNAFCTKNIGDYTLHELKLSSNVKNFDQCFIKSIRSKMNTLLLDSNSPNMLRIMPITDKDTAPSFCTCPFIGFAKIYGFTVGGVCTDNYNFTQSCSSTAIVEDTCASDYECKCGDATQTTAVPTTTPAVTSANTTPSASTKKANAASSTMASSSIVVLLMFSVFIFSLNVFEL